jgi:FtsZ-binding cell division protein ZapB
MERIIITFNKDGSFRGSSAQDFDGQPKPLDEAGLKAVAPAINEAALADIVRLEAEHAEKETALTKERDDLTAQVETLTSERDGLTTERDGLTGQVESLTTERDTVKTERDTITSERDAVTSERDTLLAQVEALTAQIESMTKAQEVIELEPIAPQPIPAYGVSKLSIMRRLGDKWPILKAAISTLPETVQDSWTLALGISADDPLFIEFRPQLLTILEMTEEEFDTLLTP